MMKDEDRVNKTYNEIFIDKVFSAVANDIKKSRIKTTWEEFMELAKKYNVQAEANKNIESEEE